MKKLMKTVIFIIMLIGILMCTGNVRATEGENEEQEEETTQTELTWTKEEDVKISIEGNKLKISGLKADTADYIYVASGSAPVVSFDEDGEPKNAEWNSANASTEGKIAKYLELNKDVYVTIVESQLDSTKIQNKEIVSGKKIERPALDKVGQRVKSYFFSDNTSIQIFEPTISDGSAGTALGGRNMKIKIGTITDKNVLRDIKDGKANALTNLLNYAKTAKSIYTGTLPVGESKSITSGLGLANNAYYYVYMELDDENGKYYPVEDVSLYQASVIEGQGSMLFDYLSNQFKWNLEDDNNAGNEQKEEKKEEKKDNTVVQNKKLPQTGVSRVIIIAVFVVVIAGIVFAVKAKKYNV